MARETELKFAVHGLFRLPPLADEAVGIAAVVPAPVLDLRATYVDTSDLRLAREGITLRHRTGEDPARWTLKLPVSASGPLVRDEVDVAAPPGDVPAELRDLLTAWTRGARLAPVATLRTRRHTHHLLDAEGGALADVVDDEVSVLEGRRVVARFREVEVEIAELDGAGIAQVTAALTAAGALAGTPMPKAVRALGAGASSPPDLPMPTAVGPGDPAGAAVALSLRTNTRRLLVNDLGVRQGAPDAVHQMRVACRRMRSDLRTFAPLVDADWAAGLREELGWLAAALGPARDFEVLADRLVRTASRDSVDPIPEEPLRRLLALVDERRSTADLEALAALRSPRYVALLERLVTAARDPLLTDAAQVRAAEALPRLVATAWASLARAAGRLGPRKPLDDFHRARILAKRARYAAEAVAPVLGKEPQHLAEAVATVQQVLGDLQDSAVAAAFVTDAALAAPQDGALGLVAGRLVEREHQLARQGQRDFLALWPQVDRKKVRGWLPA